MRISSKPVEKTFTKDFEGFDEIASITIRQANVGDNTRRQDLLSESSLVMSDNLLGHEIKQDINMLEVFRYEAFLTLVASNLSTEEGKSWFTFTPDGKLRDEAAFNFAWNSLPDQRIADWIHECVIEVNPHWSRNSDDLGE